MAGRLGTVCGLIFGLVVVAAGSAALSPATNAESSGNRIAQGVPSVLAAQPNTQAQPVRAGSPAQEAPTPEQVKAIAHVQTCLAELGYYKGPVDGKRGRETWTAYWNFKHDHGLGGYSDLLAEPGAAEARRALHRDRRDRAAARASGRAGGDRCCASA